jgi:hypothetical protein
MDFELSLDILFKSLRLPETTLATLAVTLHLCFPLPSRVF